MAHTAKEIDSLITAVRACFRELRALGDRLHADLGVTSAMRAVMEYLAGKTAATVPEIARAKSVTRQNIQVMVDALMAAGLVETVANPGHKRSSLVTLTRRGRATFNRMHDREQATLAVIAQELPTSGVNTTLKTLAAFLRLVEAENHRVDSRNRESGQ